MLEKEARLNNSSNDKLSHWLEWLAAEHLVTSARIETSSTLKVSSSQAG